MTFKGEIKLRMMIFEMVSTQEYEPAPSRIKIHHNMKFSLVIGQCAFIYFESSLDIRIGRLFEYGPE